MPPAVEAYSLNHDGQRSPGSLFLMGPAEWELGLLRVPWVNLPTGGGSED